MVILYAEKMLTCQNQILVLDEFDKAWNSVSWKNGIIIQSIRPLKKECLHLQHSL
jgi:hypothetical protein